MHEYRVGCAGRLYIYFMPVLAVILLGLTVPYLMLAHVSHDLTGELFIIVWFLAAVANAVVTFSVFPKYILAITIDADQNIDITTPTKRVHYRPEAIKMLETDMLDRDIKIHSKDRCYRVMKNIGIAHLSDFDDFLIRIKRLNPDVQFQGSIRLPIDNIPTE